MKRKGYEMNTEKENKEKSGGEIQSHRIN